MPKATKRVRKAVLPAAGLGTRFLPATKAQPKEMLPVVDKPLIQYVVEECVTSGIENIIIVTGRGKDAIEDHFDSSPELERFLDSRGKTELAEMVRSDKQAGPFQLHAAEGTTWIRPCGACGEGAGGRRTVRCIAGRRHHPRTKSGYAANHRRLRRNRPGRHRRGESAASRKRNCTESSMPLWRTERVGRKVCCGYASWWKSRRRTKRPQTWRLPGDTSCRRKSSIT